MCSAAAIAVALRFTATWPCARGARKDHLAKKVWLPADPVRQSAGSLNQFRSRSRIRSCKDRVGFSRLLHVLSDHLAQVGLQSFGGQSPSCGIGPARNQAVGDAVSKTLAMTLGVGRGEEIPSLIPELARQDPGLTDGLGPPSRSCASIDELRLGIQPECFVEDRSMLSRVAAVRRA